MPIFRNHTPQRRNIIRVVASHTDHKDDLKRDFMTRCGYCNSPDSWKINYFEIDHFIPYRRNKKIFLTIKRPTDYDNLVYSCRSCNNAKRNKWPTDDQNIPNRNDEGFIDPCDITYNNQFSRKVTGEISYSSNLGKWMYNALKLYKPQHQIIWNIEQLEPIIEEINTIKDKVNLPQGLKDFIIAVYEKYNNYRDELRML